ncbi:hypothetical protein JCM10207_005488 [Rhodosporidiobolus poonsookiae]
MALPTSSTRSTSLDLGRTDKRALLDALAEELKQAKQQAEEWAHRMVEAEAKVEQRHRDFLDVEARLSTQRESKAATIASLRKELARLKHELKEASRVDEDEAAAYLALLSPGHGSNGTIPSSPQAHGHNGSTMSARQPLTDYEAHGSTAARDLPLEQHDRPSAPSPARPSRPDRPTSALAGHPFQTPSPYTTEPVDLIGAVSSPTALPQSAWLDSLNEPLGTEHVRPELASNGGRWSRVFPGLRRRSASRG